VADKVKGIVLNTALAVVTQPSGFVVQVHNAFGTAANTNPFAGPGPARSGRRPFGRICDRSDSPWDQAERRPSHANRCQELRREAMQEEYSSLPSVAGLRPKIRRFIQRLMRQAA